MRTSVAATVAAEADGGVFVAISPIRFNVRALIERSLVSGAISIKDADRVANRTKSALCGHRSGVLSVSEIQNSRIRLVHVRWIGKQNEKSLPTDLLARDACAACGPTVRTNGAPFVTQIENFETALPITCASN